MCEVCDNAEKSRCKYNGPFEIGDTVAWCTDWTGTYSTDIAKAKKETRGTTGANYGELTITGFELPKSGEQVWQATLKDKEDDPLCVSEETKFLLYTGKSTRKRNATLKVYCRYAEYEAKKQEKKLRPFIPDQQQGD